MYRQQLQREEYKRQQAKDQSQRIQDRQQQDIDRPDRILDAKRQYRSQVIHHTHLR